MEAIGHRSMTQTLLSAAPTASPTTRHATMTDAAMDCCVGSGSSLGPNIMQREPRWPPLHANRNIPMPYAASEWIRT